ncbi:Pre-mRNA cleavage complex II protein Clp1-domain-containing protein [Russula ochroleuca]|uniref:Polynucleotide 5'-hydroxyl-kinase GRC3 n=1 Tax=Russula ochroleuca TaxID=152965 RepID=A0A9P5MTL9_9AGAM|nr:Pre-mRNA cleavage complex II protein Clp1-domain-containing protein [Russula ochroleuca]
MSVASDTGRSNTREWALGPETEYRFELDSGTSLAIRVLKGHAEVFGAELADGKYYLFGHECKAAVFTWQGCTIEMRTPSTEYVSDETPMNAYANVHLALEKMRVRALSTHRGSPLPSGPEQDVDPEPPRVLVLGPENSGKTTVCKILTNYAVRAGQGWSPMYVNTNPSEGGWTVPGTVSAVPVTAPLGTASPANPLGSAATSAPSILSSNALLPLVYWYGHPEIKRNPLLMDRLIRILGENVTERLEGDSDGRASGVIVDTPSSFASSPSSTSTPDHRQTLIRACVDAFRINVILVVGHEKLNVEMKRTYGNRMTVVKIPKSGGVVELDVQYRQRIHAQQLHTYFYGQTIAPPRGLSASAIGDADFDGHLAPSSSVIPFGELTFLRIGEKSMAPSSALPIGATRTVNEMQPITLDPTSPGSGLLNAIIALLALPTHPEETERYDEEVLDLPVSGFLAITNMDLPNRKLTILSPSPGTFTGRTAVMGSFEWSEP